MSERSLCSSVSPSSTVSHQEMQPWVSSGSTWATSRAISPCSSSKASDKKSLFAFMPTVRASSCSHWIIWLATYKRIFPKITNVDIIVIMRCNSQEHTDFRKVCACLYFLVIKSTNFELDCHLVSTPYIYTRVTRQYSI